jgi:hypothetical protein
MGHNRPLKRNISSGRFAPTYLDSYCEERFAAFARECAVQTWASNSSDNRTLELRFISASDFPAGTPGGLKIQSHSEQPHPQKVRPSTQVNFRDERP